MSGYTPLFGSLTTGTLCGRWPDIGLWPIILSLSDKHGIVDVTPQFISGVTGLPVPDVVACMERFCEPDEYSRTADCDGRRLELVDPDNRPWGWRIVNHGKYREKARLAAKNAREVAEGKNAERMAHRGGTAADRRGPPLTDPSNADADANADANANANANLKKEEAPAFDLEAPNQPGDIDLATEYVHFVAWCVEKGKAPSRSLWLKRAAKWPQYGYAKLPKTAPTDADIRAARAQAMASNKETLKRVGL